MLHRIDGTPFDDLDAFVADNPGKGFILVCDRKPKGALYPETLGIPGEKAEEFCLATYMHDCYPEWVKALGWQMIVGDDGDVTDLGPTAARKKKAS